MKRQHRVVWSKGMFLTPQHFQAQDQFVEDELLFRSRAAQFANWGVSELEIDEDSVANRTFRVIRCAGVLPDGLAFSFPESDSAPAGRSFEKLFPPEQQALDVFLAVPERHVGGQNISQADGPALRYVPVDLNFTDEYDGLEEPLQVARPNLRLIFGTEPRDGTTVLQIAQVVRGDGGRCKLNARFIPPCVNIGVSSYLLDRVLSTQLEMLSLVSNQLSAGRSEQSEYLADFSGSDIRRFWVLHVANTALPELKHLRGIGEVHPEQLYRCLLRLAGALCTFSLEYNPLDFPDYDHEQLGECFTTVAERIERMLKAIVWPPSKCVPVPLRSLGARTWAGAIADQSHLRAGELYLAFRAKPGDIDPMRFVEANVKVCGTTGFTEVRGRQLMAATLRHSSRPPVGCPSRVGSEYFKIVQTGAAWQDILDTQEVRVLVLAGLEDPVVELFMVLGS